MYPHLKIIESVSGKFGVIIKGEVDGTYFKANCSELENGKIFIHEIETEGSKNVVKEVLMWYGHVDF